MRKFSEEAWIVATKESIAAYRRLIDSALSQLSDEELHTQPAPELNSVAVLLRHLGGNLRSRWTDFLTTDGEKPDRNRDSEFLPWEGDRSALLAHFDEGCTAFDEALSSMNASNLNTVIKIRGENHSIPKAVMRSINHFAYHVGQIMMIARMVHQGDWQWATIAPGQSEQHNQRTWGSSASRGVQGEGATPNEEL